MQNHRAHAKMEQQFHWDKVFVQAPAFFGEEPSDCARLSLAHFQKEGVQTLLELGCGQGRDTMLFAQNGLDVTALDYSPTAVSAVLEKAKSRGLTPRIHAQTHDVKKLLPFPDNTFDACFAHMLLCMELSSFEMVDILRETHRILKPNGLVTYSVRSNFDKHFRTGTHLSEDMYEIGGFVIHFFTKEKIHQLAKGYEILEIIRQEEGSLPRDLFVVTLRKARCPEDWHLVGIKENKTMNDPMGKFEDFFNAAMAPGVLDHKTKQLVALGAALAAGCDS